MTANNRRGSIEVRRLAYIAILTAIVFVLQFVSLFMRFSAFSLTFVLVPIVIGVALCDWRVGTWLGFVFGVAVLVSGDAAMFLAWDPFATVVLVLLKGMLAGLIAGIAYKLLERVNKYFAVIIAAICTPLVNTSVFVFGSMLFFYDDIAALAGGEAVFPFILTGFVGINFFVELGVNLILSPTILRIISIQKKI